MCLDYLIDYKFKKHYGYKLFRVENGILYSLYGESNKPYLVGKWLKEEDYNQPIEIYQLYTNCEKEPYHAGFHIYLRKRDALDSKEFWYKALGEHLKSKGVIIACYKVKFRKVVAVGEEEGKKVVVAKEMKILDMNPNVYFINESCILK